MELSTVYGRVDHIDLGIFKTKNGTSRTVSASARLKEVLERRIDNLGPEDYVFMDEYRKYTDVGISNKMLHLGKRAEVEHGDNLLNSICLRSCGWWMANLQDSMSMV